MPKYTYTVSSLIYDKTEPTVATHRPVPGLWKKGGGVGANKYYEQGLKQSFLEGNSVLSISNIGGSGQETSNLMFRTSQTTPGGSWDWAGQSKLGTFIWLYCPEQTKLILAKHAYLA